jgi:hypothetical protein
MTDDDGRHDSSGKKVLIYFADAHKLPDFSWHNIPKQDECTKWPQNKSHGKKVLIYFADAHQCCQIFIGTTYQNRKNVPNGHKMNQMATKNQIDIKY